MVLANGNDTSSAPSPRSVAGSRDAEGNTRAVTTTAAIIPSAASTRNHTDCGVVAEREERGVQHGGRGRAHEPAEQAVVLHPHLVADLRHRLRVRRTPVVERAVIDETLTGGPVDVEVDRHRLARRDRRAPEQGEEHPEGEEHRAAAEEDLPELAKVGTGAGHDHTG